MFFLTENEKEERSNVFYQSDNIGSYVLYSSSPSEFRIISNVDPAFHFVPIIDDDDCEHFLLKMLSLSKLMIAGITINYEFL